MLGLIILALASCGGGDEKQTVCDMLPADSVAAELRKAGARPTGKLEVASDESPGLSVCRYSVEAANVRVSQDTASQAPLRYFHRITEQFEFHAGDPEREPHFVFGVGDDKRAVGGAGAYWVPANGQLIALRGERLVIATVSARGVPAERRRRAAEQLALVVFGRGKALSRTERRESAKPGLEVITPRDGSEVRESRVLVEGTVTPPDAGVRVAGREARVTDGVFKARTRLEPGENSFEVVATEGGRRIGRERLTVVRLGPASEAAARIARDANGRVPDLRGERLDIARRALRLLGIRFLEVKLGDGRVNGTEWAVCGTRPPDGSRPPRGKRVVVVVARRRLDRASGSDCAGR